MKEKSGISLSKSDLINAFQNQRIVANNPVIARRLARVAAVLRVGTKASECQFISQGATDRDIYFIFQGKASVRIQQREMITRGPGEHVGEMAAIETRHPRSVSVVAVEPVLGAKISAAAFEKIARDHPDLYRRIAIELANRLRQRGSSILRPNRIPRIFIASSSERKDVLKCVTKSLGSLHAKILPWTKGVFGLTAYTLESLEKTVKGCDFTVVILSGDDIVSRKGSLGKKRHPPPVPPR